jgi:hypothetical protein
VKGWCQVPEYKSALERVLGAGAATKVLVDVSRAEEELRSHARSMFESWLKTCALEIEPK